MLLPRLQPPLRAAAAAPIGRCGTSTGSPATTLLEAAVAQLSICRGAGNLGAVRYASHKAQGAVNKAKDGPGKRLGAKKSGEQYVIPGNIIFRQRGTHWFPGENCAMGRDHTIYATEPGFVKYYKDPIRHRKRQYIGVVFERDQVLPVPRNAERRRRLGMVAVKMEIGGAAAGGEEGHVRTEIGLAAGEADGEGGDGGAEVEVAVPLKRGRPRKERKGEEGRTLPLRPGYMYREGNWEIGRAAERAKVKVKPFKPGDRWAAWRKTAARRARNAERRGLSGRNQGKKK